MLKLNSNSSRLQLACAAIASLATCQMANAALTVNASVGGNAPAGVAKLNLDSLSLGASGGSIGQGVSVSFTTDGQVVTGSVANVYRAPVLSGNNAVGFGNVPATGNNASKYITTGRVDLGDSDPNGSATLTFAATQTYLGLLWGSTDGYNELAFYNNNVLVGKVVPGTLNSGIVGSPNVGMVPNTSGSGDPSGTFYVNITSTQPFNKVVARSLGSYAFEFDNIAVVPEPSTYVAGGLALLPLLFGLRSRFMKK